MQGLVLCLLSFFFFTIAQPTVWDIVVGQTDLQNLEDALSGNAAIVTALGTLDPITLFAPNTAIAPGTDALLHVIGGDYPATTLLGYTNGTYFAQPTSNSFLWIFSDAATVKVCSQNCATVVEADLVAVNGRVHKIDDVLTAALPNPVLTIAVNAGFSTLASVLDAAGLLPALSGAGPFTVFAPTDDAFDASLSLNEQICLTQRYTDILADILKFHVLSGIYPSFSLAVAGSVATLEGQIVTLATFQPFLNTTDIFGTNGVIHTLNSVLYPDSLPGMFFSLNCRSVWEKISSIFTFVGVEEQTSNATRAILDDMTRDSTIFAPTNTAIDGGVIDVDGYWFAGSYNVSELTDDRLFLNNVTFIRTFVTPGSPNRYCSATCSTPFDSPISAYNGWIHPLNSVLQPAVIQTVSGSINTTAALNGTFKAAIDAAGLHGILSDPTAKLTVIAPSQNSWDQFAATGLLGCLLLPERRQDLINILLNHVVSGDVLPDFQTPLNVTSVYNETFPIDINNVGVVNNIFSTNGVTHVINFVLLPAMYDAQWFADNCDTIYDRVDRRSDTLRFVAAISGTPLADLLDNRTVTSTLFAPVDSGFDTVVNPAVEIHVLPGSIASSALRNDQKVDFPQYDSYLRFFTGADVRVCSDNCALVTEANINVQNGIIHIIDKPLRIASRSSRVNNVIASLTPTLFTALGHTNLANPLNSNPNVTVFAPTDAAFEALGDLLTCLLLPEFNSVLADILRHHVLDRTVPSFRVATTSLVALDGETLQLPSGLIVSVDNFGYNGVVHVINQVLLPSQYTVQGLTDACQTVWDVINSRGDLTTLQGAIVAAGLVDELSDSAVNYTVFAPQNSGFGSAVLPLHILSGAEVRSSALSDNLVVNITGTNSYLRFFTTPSVRVCSQNCANVVVPDLLAQNGVVHVIDAGLVATPRSRRVNTIISENCPTLLAALTATNLVGVVDAQTAVTVFAPTEAAFAAIGLEVQCLLQDQFLNDLGNVLKHHVLGSVVPSFQLPSVAANVTTLAGNDLLVESNEAGVFLDGSARVTGADNFGYNGVVHFIDEVLLPSTYDAAWFGANCFTVWDVISSRPELSSLKNAIEAAGLVSTLDNPANTFTVLAPNNAAFAQLTGNPTVSLTFHVIGANVRSSDLSDLQLVTPLDNQSFLRVLIGGNAVYFCSKNCGRVVSADINAINGRIHIIDQVLLQAVDQSIVGLLSTNSSFSTLVTAASLVPDVVNLLSSTNETLTLFAPTNAAFTASLNSRQLTCLLDASRRTVLANILAYHVIAGDIWPSFFLSDGLYNTVDNTTIGVSLPNVNTASVTRANDFVRNGVVHTINKVLVPSRYNAAWFQTNCYTLLDAIADNTNLNAFNALLAGLADARTLLSTYTANLILLAPRSVPNPASVNLALHVLTNTNGNPFTTDLAIIRSFNTAINSFIRVFLPSGVKRQTGNPLLCSSNCVQLLTSGSSVTNGLLFEISEPLVPAADQTIVDLVVSNSDFTVLEAAVIAANLTSTLANSNALFTVFAPTDDAFMAAFTDFQLNCLVNERQSDLATILKHHVLVGEVPSFRVTAGSFFTANGSPDQISITLSGGSVIVSGATVTAADVFVNNGVIHVINKVIVPQTYNAAWFTNNCKTARSVISGDSRLTTLSTAIAADPAVSALLATQTPESFTIFAPTNQAFAAAQNPSLGVHVLDSEVMSSELSNKQYIPNPEADTFLRVFITGETVRVCSANCAIVTEADIPAGNGVIHVIDTVLVPAQLQTIADIVAGNPDFSILEEFLVTADLVGALDQSSATLTVFAPTNDAWSTLTEDEVACLTDGDHDDDIATILTYHVVNNILPSFALTEGPVETLEGEDIVISLAGGVTVNADSSVVTADIFATNGVIHVIDKILIPSEYTPEWFEAECPPDRRPPASSASLLSFETSFGVFLALVAKLLAF